MADGVVTTLTRRSSATLIWIAERTMLVCAVLLTGYAAYAFLLVQVLGGTGLLGGFLVLWFCAAYMVMPRVHRLLAKVYVPDYFIGRVRTAEGLLGDPVNVAGLGDADDVIAAMSAAGWTRADDLTWRSGLRLVVCTVLRRTYDGAPVSSLFLFGRKQDFAFQQVIVGAPHRRHHVRFWHTPEHWLMPGGHAVDWLAAGTYDRSVGFSLYTLQITHKIAENTDEERDYIVRTLESAGVVRDLTVVANYSTGYHHRNGGGDSIVTDGHLPIVDVSRALSSVDGACEVITCDDVSVVAEAEAALHDANLVAAQRHEAESSGATLHDAEPGGATSDLMSVEVFPNLTVIDHTRTRARSRARGTGAADTRWRRRRTDADGAPRRRLADRA